jgi:Uma2 family endonuclease
MSTAFDFASFLGRYGGRWSERAYLDLPELPLRVELANGTLVMSPAPTRPHQRLITALTTEVDAAVGTVAAGRLEAVAGIDVRLWRDHIRVPDIVVVGHSSDAVADAADVALAVEITSPGNVRQDRIVKHGEYAEAGIPFYVRVDLHLGVEALTATAYELVDGEYTELAYASDGVLRLERPWPVEVDLRAAARG